jgi:hypothetical protein
MEQVEGWNKLSWLQMKTVLGRGVSGDLYSLAETLLQLALNGPAPNQLLLSLLNHSLATQVEASKVLS